MHSKDFIEGIKKYYNVNKEDICKFHYIGGGCVKTNATKPFQQKAHYSYYMNHFFERYGPIPDKDYCACGHKIVHQVYIRNPETEKIINIGNCCERGFNTPNGYKRRCEICQAFHRNRLINRCNHCREVDVCRECLKEQRDFRFESLYCEKCNDKYCRFCGYKKQNRYQQCYMCLRKIQNGQTLTERPLIRKRNCCMTPLRPIEPQFVKM